MPSDLVFFFHHQVCGRCWVIPFTRRTKWRVGRVNVRSLVALCIMIIVCTVATNLPPRTLRLLLTKLHHHQNWYRRSTFMWCSIRYVSVTFEASTFAHYITITSHPIGAADNGNMPTPSRLPSIFNKKWRFITLSKGYIWFTRQGTSTITQSV